MCCVLCGVCIVCTVCDCEVDHTHDDTGDEFVHPVIARVPCKQVREDADEHTKHQ